MKRNVVLIIFLWLLVACGGEPEPTTSDSIENEALIVLPTEAASEANEVIQGATEETPSETVSELDNSAETTTAPDMASGFLDSYAIDDTGFGTQVSVVIDAEADTRTITSNALPNHETGEFPNPGNPNMISEQDKSWTYTTEPVFIGAASPVREPGVAINGVKLEPGTAERATCETGEVHSIEAIQDVTDLGLDFNLAHVQPTGEYHYHGVSDLLVGLYSTDQDLVHVAFAADGHLIYYSKSGAYQASYRLGEDAREGSNCTYTPGRSGNTITFGADKDGALQSDWEFDASYGQLDECNGITVDGQYIYLVTNDYPYIPRCLMGESNQTGPGGGNGGAQGGQGGGQGDRPDFAIAATALGITEQELTDALGGAPPDFEAAAEVLDISAEEIQAAVRASRGGENGAPAAEETAPEAAANAIVGDGIEAIGEGRLFELPGDNVYPEGVSYNPANGKFYVGATSDGTLYEGVVNGDSAMTVFSEGGADGRTEAIGTKVDSGGNLWVAGGNTGQMWVYNTADGALIAQFTTPSGDATFINDMAVTDSGVYFTDSFRPIIWRISDLSGGEAEAWLDLTGSAINYVQGFNLNGIIATADGNDLIVIHSGEGELYRINIATQAVTWIETGTTPLTAGDGLALSGQTLYVTRNNFGEIVPIMLADDLSSGTGGEVITSSLFGYPTTIAYTGNTFLVANSQFNNRNSGTPDLPFTVAQIPLQIDDPSAESAIEAAIPTGDTVTLHMDAWADNWFAAYLGESLLVEDSVSITTERSFNAESVTFDASYPLNLNFILKDFKENDTGLEYIGANNQQMGDGGFIMQLTDTGTGAVVGVTDSAFACIVIHEAPLDKSCESESNPVVGTAPCDFVETSEPEGWQLADFDDSAWTATTIHSANAVDPKQGYNNVSWTDSAEFIWGPDLETNNTLLCRVTISAE